MILLISAPWVARIAGESHWCMMENDFPSKCSLKASWSSYIHTWLSIFQSLETKKSLYIDKKNNPSGIYNNYKHIYAECWHTQFHNGNTTAHKSSDKPNTIIVDDFITSLPPTDTSSRQKNQAMFRTKWNNQTKGTYQASIEYCTQQPQNTHSPQQPMETFSKTKKHPYLRRWSKT
jgi:hypothetical protein